MEDKDISREVGMSPAIGAPYTQDEFIKSIKDIIKTDKNYDDGYNDGLAGRYKVTLNTGRAALEYDKGFLAGLQQRDRELKGQA